MFGDGDPYTPDDMPPQPPRRKRHPLRTAALISVLIGGAAGVAFVVAGGGGAGSFTVHGAEQVCVDAPDVTTGTQVTITDATHRVIGTGTLADDNSAAAQQAVKTYDSIQAVLGALGGTQGMTAYAFTATVPAGQARYGIDAGLNRGTIWFTEQQMKTGPDVTLGC